MAETQDKSKGSQTVVEVERVTPNGRITYDILSILNNPNARHHFSVLDTTISIGPLPVAPSKPSASPALTGHVIYTGHIDPPIFGFGQSKAKSFLQRKRSRQQPSPTNPHKK